MQDFGDKVRISVRDTGAGIDEEIIRNLYHDNVPSNKIGLYNVHQRVKLIYGDGVVITRLEPGTEVYFDVRKGL
ncbi:Sensor histidine kinase YpdA [compost metagenome]